MKNGVVSLALMFVALLPSTAIPCTGITGAPVTWTRDADVIVRVRALEQVQVMSREQFRQTAATNGRNVPTAVRFEVLEVLKGSQPAALVDFEGEFTNRGDPNDRPVPYTFVRPQGRSGNCFAFRYQQGGEYLLMLRQRNGSLTPYWATLGATNEQIVGADDQWVSWVRRQIQLTQR